MIPFSIKLFSIVCVILWIIVITIISKAGNYSSYGGGSVTAMWAGVIIFPILLTISLFFISKGKSQYWIILPLFFFVAGLWGLYQYKFSSKIESYFIETKYQKEQKVNEQNYNSALLGDSYVYSGDSLGDLDLKNEQIFIKIVEDKVYIYKKLKGSDGVIKYFAPEVIGNFVETNVAKISMESDTFLIEEKILKDFKNKDGKSFTQNYQVIYMPRTY